MAANGYVAIPGSEREPMPGATKSGPCDPTAAVELTVVLRPLAAWPRTCNPWMSWWPAASA